MVLKMEARSIEQRELETNLKKIQQQLRAEITEKTEQEKEKVHTRLVKTQDSPQVQDYIQEE